MFKKYFVIRVLSVALLATGAANLGGCTETPASSKQRAASKAGGAKATGPGNHLGQPFAAKEITSLEQVFKNPKGYEGKTLRVEGVVTAHCHHQLAWFALRSDPKATQVLRVMTRPAFLVPKDVKHGVTRASAEGVIELKTVPEAHAKHLAKEHGLFGGEPDKISGPQYVLSLRASGARFL